MLYFNKQYINQQQGEQHHVMDESDIDTFLKGKQMSFLSGRIKGLDDFELICFLVIK